MHWETKQISQKKRKHITPENILQETFSQNQQITDQTTIIIVFLWMKLYQQQLESFYLVITAGWDLTSMFECVILHGLSGRL